MAPMFSAANDKGMHTWEEHCRMAINDGLWACDPITEESLQVSNTICTDDVHDTNVTETVADMNAAQTVNSQFFDHELECKGLGRNGDKEEHLIQCRGKGAVKRRGRHVTNSPSRVESSDGHDTWVISLQRTVARGVMSTDESRPPNKVSKHYTGYGENDEWLRAYYANSSRAWYEGRSCLAWKRKYPT